MSRNAMPAASTRFACGIAALCNFKCASACVQDFRTVKDVRDFKRFNARKLCPFQLDSRPQGRYCVPACCTKLQRGAVRCRTVLQHVVSHRVATRRVAPCWNTSRRSAPRKIGSSVCFSSAAAIPATATLCERSTSSARPSGPTRGLGSLGSLQALQLTRINLEPSESIDRLSARVWLALQPG